MNISQTLGNRSWPAAILSVQGRPEKGADDDEGPARAVMLAVRGPLVPVEDIRVERIKATPLVDPPRAASAAGPRHYPSAARAVKATPMRPQSLSCGALLTVIR